MVKTPDVAALVDDHARAVFTVDLDAAEIDIIAEAPALDLEALTVLFRTKAPGLEALGIERAVIARQLCAFQLLILDRLFGLCPQANSGACQQWQADRAKSPCLVTPSHGLLPVGLPKLKYSPKKLRQAWRPKEVRSGSRIAVPA